MTANAPPLAKGTRPVPESEAGDTGTLLCPASVSYTHLTLPTKRIV